MKDRVPRYPGRVTLTPVSGQANTYDMVRADQPTQEGTPINKDTLLKDTTAAALGLTGDPTVDDAFARLAKKSEYKVGDIKVTARTDLGDEWALCNGAGVPSDAAELSALLPQNEYPFSTFDVLNFSNYDSVYDVFNSADGKIYVLANQYNESNQQRQCVFQISPSDGVLRKLEITSIPSFSYTGHESWAVASSVFVDNNKIYLFGMPGEPKISALPIVVYGNFTGEEFPTTWTTVEISIPSPYKPLNTNSVGSMGKMEFLGLLMGNIIS